MTRAAGPSGGAGTSTGERPLAGGILMVVTALFWAGAWITARVAAHDAPPLTVTVGRFAVASALLLPAWWWLERGRSFRLDRSEWGVLLGMSATGIMGYTVLFMLGVAMAPASDGALIVPGLAGPFSMLVAWAFLRERPAPHVAAGAAMALTGVLLVGWSSLRTAGADSQRIEGDAVFVGAALVWATYTVLGRRLAHRVPAVTGILLCSVIGVVLLSPVALLHDGLPALDRWSRAAWVNVTYLGAFGTAVAFVTYYLGVRMSGLGRAMPALGLVPLFGVALAAVLLHERLTLLHAAGGALVVTGILVSGGTLRRRPPRRPPLAASASGSRPAARPR